MAVTAFALTGTSGRILAIEQQEWVSPLSGLPFVCVDHDDGELLGMGWNQPGPSQSEFIRPSQFWDHQIAILVNATAAGETVGKPFCLSHYEN